MIREITAGELPALAKLGFEFFREAGFTEEFVPEIFVQSYTSCMEAGCAKIFCSFTDLGEIQGTIGLVIGPDPNNGRLYAQEAFWFVKKEHRGCGVRLLKYAEDYAKSAGVYRMMMAHLTSLAPTTLKSLYLRLGYLESETYYRKTL